MFGPLKNAQSYGPIGNFSAQARVGIVTENCKSFHMATGSAITSFLQARRLGGEPEVGYVGLWESGPKDAGLEMSVIEAWDAEAAAISEYDRLHKLVREFASTGNGQAQFVAPALRGLLESFLRVAFVEHFPPGKLLGEFLSRAKQLAQAGKPILSEKNYTELDDLREYANQFHHNGGNKTWQENVSNVNETQLKGFANRVLAFTRTSHGA
jgi:hypothetical protein